MKMISLCAIALLCAACSIIPRETRLFDPDEEFAKLDGPEVPSLEQSLARGAERAMQEGQYERALSLYQQLVDTNQNQIEYKFGMAEALRRLGEHKAAIILYDEVTQKDPKRLEAFESKALSKMGLGETEEAARILQRVLQNDRRRWRTLNALGLLFAERSMFSESETYLKEAIKVSPNHPSALNNLGLVQAIQKQYPAAIDMLKEAARHASDNNQREQIDMNRALIHGIMGDTQQAEAIASQYLDGASLQNNLGLYAYLRDNRELAKSYLNMALTGTQTYYKRAWENLDIISVKDDSGTKSRGGGKSIKVQ